MKVEKVSKMALYICVGIILVCFALFLTIGYDNPVGEYNEPMLTDVIMWLMYALALSRHCSPSGVLSQACRTTKARIRLHRRAFLAARLHVHNSPDSSCHS